MKKIIVVLLLAALSVTAFAQESAATAAPAPEFTVSGEAKSGVLWVKSEDQINDKPEKTVIGSMDDAGFSLFRYLNYNETSPGRFRVNMEYSHNNIGFKVRFNYENWATNPSNLWSYAFGYGDFFNEQLTLSIGKLGASPWGTGGPDMWKELEQVGSTGGIRIEYKPSFVPGDLNVGFVLNGFNGSMEQATAEPITFLDVLQESVIGASYTHEFFHVRLAYRLDSELDGGRTGATSGKDGGELVYRAEERVLKNLLPGFQVGALGYWEGLGADEENRDKGVLRSENWLFVTYAPDLFTAQIRFGYDVNWNRSILHIKPSFYWNFFDKLISVGAAFMYGQDFGDGKVDPGSPYSYIEIEPRIMINFSANAYAAFRYNFRQEYVGDIFGNDGRYIYREARGIEPIHRIQWMNLYFGLKF